MDLFTVGFFSALWLGILTSISPCPMATNIAAISFIGKNVGNSRKVFLHGLIYTSGRMAAYLIISIIIVSSLLSLPEIARFLNKYMNWILVPLLIIVGLYLLEIIKLGTLGGNSLGQKYSEKLSKKGIWGTFLLGNIFALSFCPVSAGLFFGSLIPLSLKYESEVVLPLVYGIGTALPVIIFAFVLGFSANFVAKLYNNMQVFEKWSRKITGAIFIIAALYLVFYKM